MLEIARHGDQRRPPRRAVDRDEDHRVGAQARTARAGVAAEQQDRADIREQRAGSTPESGGAFGGAGGCVWFGMCSCGIDGSVVGGRRASAARSTTVTVGADRRRRCDGRRRRRAGRRRRRSARWGRTGTHGRCRRVPRPPCRRPSKHGSATAISTATATPNRTPRRGRALADSSTSATAATRDTTTITSTATSWPRNRRSRPSATQLRSCRIQSDQPRQREHDAGREQHRPQEPVPPVSRRRRAATAETSTGSDARTTRAAPLRHCPSVGHDTVRAVTRGGNPAPSNASNFSYGDSDNPDAPA